MNRNSGGRASRVVRPYAITGGRIRDDQDELEVETLVTTTSLGVTSPGLNFEWRTIALLCRDVLSLAEISAKLQLPLGVIRLLVADMSDQGLVDVHRPAAPGDRPDLALLERVLYGLRHM
jgi:Protein of unknown function (DUF742)